MCGLFAYIAKVFTNNNYVNGAVIYLTAIAFALCILPVYVYNYAFISTKDKSLTAKVLIYKLIPIYRFEKRLNGKIKEEHVKAKTLKLKYPRHYLDLYNKLCITKIVQICDFGMQNQVNAYAALTQNVFTKAAYGFVKANGEKTKLRNFVLLNEEHGDVVYCIKLVGVVNLVTLIKIGIIYLWSLFNERKSKKNAGR